MHDLRFIRENPDEFDRRLGRRPLSEKERKDFSSRAVLAIDDRRRAIIRVNESARALHKKLSGEFHAARKKGGDIPQHLIEQIAEQKRSIDTTETEQSDAEKELNNLLAQIPNLPLDEVPDGADEHGNVEHHVFGAKRNYAFDPKQHFELGEALGQMDFEAAAKLSGARFVVLKKGLARMERALGQFMLDVHTSEPHNYTEISPPILVRDDAMFGTAQLPKFEEDQFPTFGVPTPDLVFAFFVKCVEDKVDDRYFVRSESGGGVVLQETGKDAFREFLRRGSRLWLIPTAEVPLTNLVRESILDEAELPLRFTACTPCFRAEAGAAGRDTRGMIRQHQFTKVELVSITTPEKSKDEHDRMLACAEEVLRRLDLHYRVVTLCAGDMGFASQKTYDIEVWLPGQGAYREISSCSVCGDFQARRMNARYRTTEGRSVRPVHTLNGSGVAVGRALIAVMETYQQGNGRIAVPDALAPYMGGLKEVG